MKTALGLPVIFGRLLHLAMSVVVIIGFSYALGHVLLEDPLRGGDRPLHIAYIEWLNIYFPDIPHWFPSQGGGMSLLHGYPLVAHWLVILLSRLSGLSLLQAGSIVSFLSFPLTAIGIYVFCWTALKNQTVGLIAAVLFLLTPLTWTWIHDWGFFPYGVAIVFLPLTLIFYDQYLSVVLRDPRSSRRRIWMVGVIMSIALSTIAHPAVGASGAMAILLFALFSALTCEPGKRAEFLRHTARSFLFIGPPILLLLAFYAVPFYQYGQIANREGLNSPALNQIVHIPRAEFLGLRPIDSLIVHTRMSNPLVVTLLLGIGLLLSPRMSRKAFALILTAIFAGLYSLFPELPYSLGKLSSILPMVFGLRASLGIVMVLFPVGAAFGAWALANAVLVPSTIIRRREDRNYEEKPQRLQGRGLVASGLALVLVGFGAIAIGRLHSIKPYHLSYGPSRLGIDTRDIWELSSDDPCELPTQRGQVAALCNLSIARAKLNIQDFKLSCNLPGLEDRMVPPLCNNSQPTTAAVQEFIEGCQEAEGRIDDGGPCGARVKNFYDQLAIEKWSWIQFDDSDWLAESTQQLASILPTEGALRVDMSPYQGYLAQYLTAYTDASQIPAYGHQLSLIHLMWGYQLGVFYSDEYGSPEALNDIADWMGISYAILDPDSRFD